MALPLSDFVTWLAANGIPDVLANWMPAQPDQVVVVSGSPGGPPTMDGHQEANHFHIRCRDAKDSLAEATALQIHTLITGQGGSVQMGGTWVVSIEAASGQPTYLLRDTSNRTTYMATYLVTTLA